MCCIFTCCGWMIDLLQRLWTFTMSCCISSAVCCVMLTSSMSGIALGYNYSLSEFVDLKETNVSIYLKRGVFDDEIADDMDWRRSGRQPVAGHIGSENLRTGEPDDDESTTLRSGRRLEDSVFEADDQNKYEGSLMKLTAKPVFEDTPRPLVTDDLQMADAVTRYPQGSLDQMKAIQSLIDSRRAMATGGTTLSPLATYKSQEEMLPYMPMNTNPNDPGNPDANFRRMMGPGAAMHPPNLNPARFAVPGPEIASRNSWLVPKNPALFDKTAMPDYFILSPTYPSPITVKPGTVRPTLSSLETTGGIMFVTRTIASTRSRGTKPPVLERIDKESEIFNEELMLEKDRPSKDYARIPKLGKSSEEEYEDEIKGLPVRKRRDAKLMDANRLTERNISDPYGNNITDNNGSLIEKTTLKSLDISYRHNDTNHTTTYGNKSSGKEDYNSHNDIQILKERDTNEQVKAEEDKSYTGQQVNTMENESSAGLEDVTTGEHNSKNPSVRSSLLDRIGTIIETKKSTLTDSTERSNLVSAKNIRRQTRRKSFESKIVSSKYVPYNEATRSFDTKRSTISNAEVLNSISVSLNEAGLLKNPASSTFVKLLQTTLT